MLIVMSIVAQRQHIDLAGTTVEVIKEMVTAPIRRIGKIYVSFQMTKGINPSQRSLLEKAAHISPVHQSLHPDVKILEGFHYPD